MKIYTSLTPKECLKRIKNPQAYLGEINRKKYDTYYVDLEGKTKKGKRLHTEVNDSSFGIFVRTWGVYRRHFYMERPWTRQVGLLRGTIYESETRGAVVKYRINYFDLVVGLITLLVFSGVAYNFMKTPNLSLEKIVLNPWIIVLIVLVIQVTQALVYYMVTLRFMKDLLITKDTREGDPQQVRTEHKSS